MLLFWTSSHRIFLNLKQYYLTHLSCVANTQENVAIYTSKGLISRNYSFFKKCIALFGLQSLNFGLLFIFHTPKRNLILSDVFTIQCLSFLQDTIQMYSNNLNISLGMPAALQLSFKMCIST